jgi:hypothetical protein
MKRFRIVLFSVVTPLALLCLDAGSANAADRSRQDCEALSSTKVANTVLRATYVTTKDDLKAILGQGGARSNNALLDAAPIPFCRVEATITPAPGAEIKSEIWLPPTDKWNGRFLGAGNGGAAGAISPATLAAGLSEGYAIAHSDAGSHSLDKGPDGADLGLRFGRNQELKVNFAYRGYHLTTVLGKQLVQLYYRKKPEASLFMGCSAGGYEAMTEAQRYPNDYNGIIAGDPAIHWAQLGLWQGMSYVATHQTPGSAIPAAKLPAIYQKVVDTCDGLDGVKDGIINDPRQCKVDFKTMLCTANDNAQCLTAPQVAAITKIYSPLYNPRTHELLYPGFTPGAESAAAAQTRISGGSVGSTITSDVPGTLIWNLPENFTAADWLKFDFNKGSEAAIKAYAPYASSSPDLRPFFRAGGKLILYTGWADPNINPQDLVNYYNAVEKTVGGAETRASSRLFLVPGLNHCAGGPGANVLGQNPTDPAGPQTSDASDNILLALDRWVTKKVPPEEIIATRYVDNDKTKGVQLTRPICAFPLTSKWKGTGSTDDAKNFECVKP